MANASDLPRELLFLIAKCLKTYSDLLHFRSVCSSWRASAPLTQPPNFCLPVHLWTEHNGKSFLIQRTFCLLEFLGEDSQTTPHFLIVMLEGDECGKKHILDPLLRDQFKLRKYPFLLDVSKFHIEELGREYVIEPENYKHYRKKVAYLNSSPIDNEHFTLLGAANNMDDVCFVRSRGEFPTPFAVVGWLDPDDVIQFKGKFYAVNTMGETVCIEPYSGASFLLAKLPVDVPVGQDNIVDFYLVEWFGNLLTVLVEMESEGQALSAGFKLFQLDHEVKKWDRLESLGDGILFMDPYCHFSLPVIPGVAGNCILYTLGWGIEKAHVFSLKSGKSCPLSHRRDLFELFRLPSFW